MDILKRRRWSPYLAGSLIGVLSWFAFWSADHPLGVSSAFVRLLGMAEDAAIPAHASGVEPFAKLRPFFDWEFALVLGLFLGAWVAGRMGGKINASSPRSMVTPILGGFLLMFGARLAGGCTSGHGISGSLQLALSGWTFFAVVFAAGILTAKFWMPEEDRHV